MAELISAERRALLSLLPAAGITGVLNMAAESVVQVAEHDVIAPGGEGMIKDDRTNLPAVRMGKAFGAQRPTAGQRRQMERTRLRRGPESRLAGKGQTGFDYVLDVGWDKRSSR